MYYQRTLPNGIRVVGQQIEGFHSVSVGIWTRTGSANELGEKERGITHFIEHMLFKGTQRRTAQQIAAEMDGMGGILNAFTSKECTCYHARVSGEKLAEAYDILSDIVLHATLNEQEMEREKGVVLEEINMSEDMPEDLVHELLAQAYFGDHALALPILGNKQSVSSFTREDLLDYMHRRYVPQTMVVAAAGGFDFEMLCDMVERTLGQMPRSDHDLPDYPAFTPHSGRVVLREKPIEQAHLCMATPAFALGDDRIFALSVLNNAFGGGMSSRLFQKIREERGLAYDVYSHPSSYLQCGAFTIYTGINAAHTESVIELVLQEMEEVKRNGLSKEEFTRAKDQLKGNYVLGLESTSSRMNALGKAMTMQGELRTAEQMLEGIEKVDMDAVAAILPTVFDLDRLSISAVGNIRPDAIRKAVGK